MMSTDILTNPFPGLRAFEEDEEYLFFGRENQIDELLTKLRTSRFLAVIGVSGSGKSSLVKSGLLPALYSGYMAQAGSHWRIATFRPGGNPIGNMAEALSNEGVLYETPEEGVPYKPIIESTLRRSNRGLIEAVRQARMPKNENLLVLVDQYEELFRFSKFEKARKDGTSEAQAFVKLLLTASEQADYPIYIVFTMRSDFLGDCTEFRGLPEAINAGQYLIPRMTREERKAAIAGPIAVGGGQVTQTLISRLLNDVGDNPDQLPILQHALMRTWDMMEQEGGEEKELDLRHYEAAGTMSKALSQHAEEAFAEISTSEKRYLCEKMFKALTDKGGDSRGVRRPSTMAELCALTGGTLAEVTEVVNVFRKPGRSFLMPSHEIPLTEDTVIDISHESLMRIWGRLIRWVEEEKQAAEVYIRLAETAALYQEGKSGLWRNPELQLALKWRETTKPNEQWALRYDPSFDRAILFLDQSEAQYIFEEEQKEKRRRKKLMYSRLIAGFMLAVSLVSVFFMVKAFASEREAKQAQEEAIASRNKAKEAEARALVEKDSATAAESRAIEARAETRIALLGAEKARDNAKEAEEKAKNEAANARKAEQKAKDAEQLANDAAELARLAEEEAKRDKEKADSLKAESDTLSNLSRSRVMSNKALQFLREDRWQESNDTALVAHELNKRFKGPFQNNDNFNAMLSVLELTPRHTMNAKNAKRCGIRAIVPIPGSSNEFLAGDELGNLHKMNIQTKVAKIPWKDTVVTYDTIQINGQIRIDSTVVINDVEKDSITVKLTDNIVKSDLPSGARIRSLSYSQGGTYVMIATTDGRLIMYPANDFSKAKATSGAASAAVYDDVGYSAKTGKVYCVSQNKLLSFSLNGDSLIQDPQKIQEPVRTCALSESGTYLAYATDSEVIVYDLVKDKVFERDDFANATCIDISETHNALAAGNKIGEIMAHDLSKGETANNPQVSLEHQTSVTAVRIGKAGNKLQLATAGMDHTIQMFMIESFTGKYNRDDDISITAHDSWAWDLSYSKDYEWLISVGKDQTVKIWPTTSEAIYRILRPSIAK